MVLPHITLAAFHKHIISCGFKLIDTHTFNNKVYRYYRNDLDTSFSLVEKELYYFDDAGLICDRNGIIVPKELRNSYEQIKNYPKQ